MIRRTIINIRCGDPGSVDVENLPAFNFGVSDCPLVNFKEEMIEHGIRIEPATSRGRRHVRLGVQMNSLYKCINIINLPINSANH